MTAIAGKARARATDPDTSRAAAASLTSEAIRLSQSAVLRTLGRLRKGTDQDIAAAYVTTWGEVIPQSPSGLRTRRSELVDAGLVVDTGKRKKLPSGRKAIVWAKAPKKVGA